MYLRILVVFYLACFAWTAFGRAVSAEEASPSEAKAKLEALEKAYKAGVLTDEEYEQKKAAVGEVLKAAAPKISPETQRKLQALETAHQSGILNDAEYAKKKAELLGATQAGSAPSEAPSARPEAALKGKTYSHPIGFKFWYPDGWKPTLQGEMILLVPPNVASTPQGPSEIYFIFGESVAGENITKPDDPRVAQYFDEQVRALSPVLQRVGQTASVDMSKGKGAVLNWEAKGETGTVQARLYVAIIKDNGVALGALGLKDLVQKRDPDLRRMFASFSFGEGQKDPKLVGTWKQMSSHAISNTSPWETDWSRAKMASSKESVMELRADGTWYRTKESYMLAGASGIWLEDKSVKKDNGTWCAGNGSLYLMWADDTWAIYQYRLEQKDGARQLRLVSGKTGETWQAQ